LFMMGGIFYRQKQYDRALPYISQAYNLSRNDQSGQFVQLCLYRLGIISLEQGIIEKAIEYFSTVLESRPEAREDDLGDADTYFQLGRAMEAKGDFESSQKKYLDCLRIQIMKCPKGSVELGQTTFAVGRVTFKLQDYNEALKQLEDAQRILRKQFGNNSLEALEVTNILADVYDAMGEHEKAFTCLNYSSRVLKATAGCEALQITAETMTKLGHFFLRRHVFEQAVVHFKDAVNSLKLVSGDDSLQVADGINCIANVLLLDSVAQYEAALKCCEEVRRIYDLHSLSMDRRYAKVLSQIGMLKFKRKEVDQSLDAYKRSIAIYHKLDGDDHLDTAAALHELAKIYIVQGQDGLALDSLRKTLRARKMCLGDDHVLVGSVLQDKGCVHESRGEFEEAMDCYEECLRIYKINEVARDHDIFLVLSKAGILAFDSLNDSGKALKLLKEAEEKAMTSAQIDESRNETLVGVLQTMAQIQNELGNVDGAIESFQRYLGIQKRNLGENNSVVATTLFNIGSIYVQKKDYTRALSFYDEALKIRKALTRPDSSNEEFMELGLTLYKIGIVLKNVGQFEKSMKCFEQSLHVQQAKMSGIPSELTAKTFNNLGVVASKTGKYAVAARYWHQAIEEYKRAIQCDEGDRVVQSIRGNIAMAERLCIH